ncbi:MAG TPA: hypothetical protein VKU00_11160 [Chthonomonadaceae bacterium]|nr:hypothetical protein [Chthonomonadaceae bacterium]
MSFDLAIWSSNRPLTAAETYPIYAALCDNDLSLLTPAPNGNEAIAAFLDGLGQTYPDLDTVPVSELKNCPWAFGFWPELLPRPCQFLHISWPWVAEVAPFVIHLAVKHHLVCYDPQTETISLPDFP